MKTLDETISYYKKKYNLLKDYDPLKAEEYKQLYEWLEDYKELKENKNNRFQMIEEAIKSKEEINCQ